MPWSRDETVTHGVGQVNRQQTRHVGAGGRVRLAERLDGRRVLITGVTGFVGEALLHRLLHDVPGITPVVLVRPKAGQPGRDRIAALLAKPIFAPSAEAAGGVDALLERRRDRRGRPDRAARTCRTSTWSCTAPATCRSTRRSTRRSTPTCSGSGPCSSGSRRSTPSGPSAGPRRSTTCTSPRRTSGGGAAGRCPRARWTTPSTGGPRRPPGKRLAERIEDASRSPKVLEKLLSPGRARPRPGRAADRRQRGRGAAQDLGRRPAEARRPRAGPHAGLDRRLHVHQVDGRAGRRGARPGADQRRRASAPKPVSIVRPSIIESALRTPYPGWIEGFKMAEPLILAFGRGELPEFPAAPDSVVDIVPVDHVVGAIIGVMATEPEPGVVDYFHVSSGRAQPAAVPAALRADHRLLRPAPVRHGRARRGAAAQLAVPGCREGGTPSRARGTSPSDGRPGARPGAAQRPGPRAGPRPGPAEAAAGLPAPLPRPLSRLRRGRAAVHGRQHDRALPHASSRRTRRSSGSTRPSSPGSTTCATCTSRR